MIYLELFLCFFQIGIMSMGGGYVVIPLVQNQVVLSRGWLTMAQFTDLVTIAEMTPGPISLNAATFVGNQMAGVLGGIVASIGCIAPSCIIVSIMAYVYFRYKDLWVVNGFLKGVRPAVAAFVASAGVSILRTALFGGGAVSLMTLNMQALVSFLLCLAVLRTKKVNPIFVMLGAGVLGTAVILLRGGALF